MGGFVGTVLFGGQPPEFGDRWGRALAGLRARAPGEIHEAKLSGPEFQARFAQLGHAPRAAQHGTLLLDAPPRVLAKIGQAIGPDTMLALRGENFAAAWIDARAGGVQLWADRLASRSLVYTLVDRGFAFASEIRCLAPFMDAVAPDPNTLNELFQFRWLVGHDAGIRKVARVPAAQRVSLVRNREPLEETWEDVWQPRGGTDTQQQLVAKAQSELVATLERVSAGHTSAVVLVSGGVDSALLASLARRAFPRVVGLTASVAGFDNPELDRARAVAGRLGIEHHVIDVGMDYVAEAFPRLVQRLEAPPKHLNSVILMRLFEAARDHGEIILHGDCADTIFGSAGLQMALNLHKKQKLLDRLPATLATGIGRVLRRSGRARMRRLGGLIDTGWTGVFEAVESLQYRRSIAPLGLSARGSMRGVEYVAATYPADQSGFGDWFATAQLYSFGVASWHRLERVSSPLGLEICMPFIEPEVMAVGAAIPMHLTCVGGETKPILKQLAREVVGEDVAAWPKLGFPSPEGTWLRSPLRPFAQSATRADSWVRSWIDLDGLSDKELDSDELLMGTLAGLEEWHRQAGEGFHEDQ